MKFLFFLPILFSFFIPSQKEPQEPLLLHQFNVSPQGEMGQCNGGFYGIDTAPFGAWSKEIRIDTDNRPGGCFQRFSIFDPDHRLKGLELGVEVLSDNGQCKDFGSSYKRVPFSHSFENLIWSDPIMIDTDDTPGSCILEFSVHGRSDIVLETEFRADDRNGQCLNTGKKAAWLNHPFRIEIDADSRPGGCRQRFRLREAY